MIAAASAYPRGTLLDLAGQPLQPSASFGQHVRRSGANLSGTLTNWVNHVVGARLAEREKTRISEKAEDLYVNSALAHGLLEGLVVETIGIGLTPLPAPMTEHLGASAEWADAYTTEVESLWEIWGFDPRHLCDAQRRLAHYQQQAWAYFSWKLHGIGLHQVRMKPGAGPYRFCLLPIDASRLVTPWKATSADIYDGVEVDADGAPVAVHIAKVTSPASSSRTNGDTVRVPVWHDETGLPQVLLTADVRNVAEYKQDSVLTPIVAEIKNNDDFVEAALIQAVQQTLITMYVSLQGSDQWTIPGSQGMVGGTPGQDVDWRQRIHEISKGTIIEGPAGYKPEFLEPKAPGASYETMWKSICTRVGMATQRGSENLLREYNSSYSAALASVENAERFSEYDRTVHVSTFCQPVFSWFLYEQALAGRLPGLRSPRAFLENLHAYTRAEWLPPPERVIRPDVRAKAEETALEARTDTLQDIYSRRGLKWKEQIRKEAAERRYRAEVGREFGVDMTRGAKPEPKSEPNGKTDPEQQQTKGDGDS